MAAAGQPDSTASVTVPPQHQIVSSSASISHLTSSQVTYSPQDSSSQTQITSTSSLWTDLFTKPSSTPLKSYPPPSYREDGTPVVRAPPEIILKASEAWKGFLLCTFFGTPLSPAKIFNDLNPIWGKNGSITVRHFTEGSCLIFIPSLRTRKWVCDVGFWSAGTVAFSAVEWSPSSKLQSHYLTSAPIWVTLKDVPPQLWSSEGFKLIASGVGTPLPMNRSSLLPDLLGSTKLRVIADLEKPLPSSVIVQDDSGNEVSIGIEIGRLPPRCGSCLRFGHSAHRCPEPQRKPPSDSHLPVDVISTPTVNSTAAVNSTTAVNTTAAIASTHPESASSPPSNHLIDDPTSPSLSSSTAPSISAAVSGLPESLFPSASVHNGGSLSVQNVSSFYPLENPNPSLAQATFSALFPPLSAQFVRHKSPKRMQISSQQNSSLKPIISGPQISSPSSLALKSPAEIASATSSLTSSHQSPITGSASQSALAARSVSPPPPESSPIISYSTSATVSSAAPATISSAAISTAAVSPAAIASAAISFSSTTISLPSPPPASSKTPPPPPIITSPIPPSDDEDFITGLVSPTSDTAAPDVEAHIKTPFSIKNKIKELSQRQFEEEEEMIASSQRMKRQALLKEKSDTPSSSAKRKATKKKRRFDRLAALKASEALSR